MFCRHPLICGNAPHASPSPIEGVSSFKYLTEGLEILLLSYTDSDGAITNNNLLQRMVCSAKHIAWGLLSPSYRTQLAIGITLTTPFFFSFFPQAIKALNNDS